jgi:hypothetical protein
MTIWTWYGLAIIFLAVCITVAAVITEYTVRFKPGELVRCRNKRSMFNGYIGMVESRHGRKYWVQWYGGGRDWNRRRDLKEEIQ